MQLVCHGISKIALCDESLVHVAGPTEAQYEEGRCEGILESSFLITLRFVENRALELHISEFWDDPPEV